MNSNRVQTVLLCLLSLALASCGSKSSSNANLRIVDAIPDAPAISVQLGTNSPIVTGMIFEQLTQYMSVPSGSQDFMVSANGNVVCDQPDPEHEYRQLHVHRVWSDRLGHGAVAQREQSPDPEFRDIQFPRHHDTALQSRNGILSK